MHEMKGTHVLALINSFEEYSIKQYYKMLVGCCEKAGADIIGVATYQSEGIKSAVALVKESHLAIYELGKNHPYDNLVLLDLFTCGTTNVLKGYVHALDFLNGEVVHYVLITKERDIGIIKDKYNDESIIGLSPETLYYYLGACIECYNGLPSFEKANTKVLLSADFNPTDGKSKYEIARIGEGIVGLGIHTYPEEGKAFLDIISVGYKGPLLLKNVGYRKWILKAGNDEVDTYFKRL